MDGNRHSVDRLWNDGAELHTMERLHVLYWHLSMVCGWCDVERQSYNGGSRWSIYFFAGWLPERIMGLCIPI